MENVYYVETNIRHRPNVLIAGDFNLSGIRWDKLSLGVSDVGHSEILFDFGFNFGFTQVVGQRTRHGKTVDTTLDLVFVSKELSNYDFSVCNGLSDNDLDSLICYLNVDEPSKKHPEKFVRNFERASDVDILDYLEVALSHFDRPRPVNEMWEDFKRIVNHGIQQYVPLKRVRKKRNPWITRDILHLKQQVKQNCKKKSR